jgi:cell division protein FtsB
MKQKLRLMVVVSLFTAIYAAVFLLTGCSDVNSTQMQEKTSALKLAQISQCKADSKDQIKELWTACLKVTGTPGEDDLISTVNSCHKESVDTICGK